MAIHTCLVTYIYLVTYTIYVRPNLVVLVFVRPNSSYVRPKLEVIGQMSCQVKYLFAALDLLLFNKVMHNPEHCLYELLPEERRRPLRERDHQFMLPKVYTERFKQSFLNKCLFNDF